MIAYPPKPTSILPDEETFVPSEWIVQPKYRGWRALIHNNNVFTRHKRQLTIKTDYHTDQLKDFQLDGEIVNPQKRTEHGVAAAIKDGSWHLSIFDIYIPGTEYTLMKRFQILEDYFNIYPSYFYVAAYDDIFWYLKLIKSHGFEGIVLKRRSSIYKASQYTSIIDPDWIKLK